MIVIGTANLNKVKEISALPAAEGLEIRSVRTFGAAPDVAEDGTTFLANAIIKAQTYSNWLLEEYGIEPLVIAEDAGLQVHALDGWPGVHSARVAETTAARNSLVLKRLADATDRTAQFIAVTALAKAGTIIHTWEGSIAGRITAEPRGEDGFGYDPIFEVPAQGRTFAEMGIAGKNKISHRTIAWTLTLNEMRGLGLLPDRRSLTRDVGLI